VTVPESWAEQARYDLDTAKAMLAAGRYLYVLFCCQQAVEKAIKAVIALRTSEMPPRLHNLMALAERAGLTVDEARAEPLRRLTRYYIETRYPDVIGRLSAGLDRRLAEEALQSAEELLKWLSTSMK
jgi:HEPN domain-containing protein